MSELLPQKDNIIIFPTERIKRPLLSVVKRTPIVTFKGRAVITPEQIANYERAYFILGEYIKE